MVKEQKDANGYLALLLHAHLPFVHTLQGAITFEEKWLFEALTESYLPMLMSWDKLAMEEVGFRLTLSISPTLLSMLIDPNLVERYSRHLENLVRLTVLEQERTVADPGFYQLAEFYHLRFTNIYQAYRETYQGNLVMPLKRLQEQGFLELITTGATHGFFPLMLTDEARQVQIRAALDLFSQVFGRRPVGFWLPECGYMPGTEKLLRSEGVKYTIIATHGLMNSVPKVTTAVYAPVKIGSGLAAFGRDWETSQQVWSRTEGYPGDAAYREFYRDIGYDLDYDYIEPFLTGGVRGDTGIKYYRITGKSDVKEAYNYRIAREKARDHAHDFMKNRDRQLSHWAGNMQGKPVIAAPYDAELYGHWWFEGPDWLEEVLRLGAGNRYQTGLTTLSAYLEAFPPVQEVRLGPSTWGDGGYNRYWVNQNNDWIYPHLHRAEKTLINLAEITNPDLKEKRVLNQIAREFLLAQSSDWPFILTSHTVVDYANRRLHEHLSNFFKLCQDLRHNCIDEAFLANLEAYDNIFPQLDFKMYQPVVSRLQPAQKTINHFKPLIMLLSWEFPPRHLGGLGIHARNLSEALVKLGMNIQVLTFTDDPAHARGGFSEFKDGYWIHYLPTFQRKDEIDFLGWVLQLNMAMADFGREIIANFPEVPKIVHAHDWMVSYAAFELQQSGQVPLVTTIHATESGRNNGIYNHLQQSIHQMEADLVGRSDLIICCSRYMEDEIKRLFDKPATEISIIPNAVSQTPPLPKAGSEQTILFIGRLVLEKGVQILLEALAGISSFYPKVNLVIAGAGYYMDPLKEMVSNLGLVDRVRFTGFVSEAARNQLLAQCNVAVFPSLYEPFGIAALEAMAAEVPVIVSRTGGLAEIVTDGVTGLCFAPGNVIDLQRCLIAVFSNPKLAEELVSKARAKINQEYTWESVAWQTIAQYNRVLARQLVKVS